MYRCEDCDEIQEVSHGMLEEPTIECPKCGSTNTRKVPTMPGVLFNWSNWDKGVVVGKDRFRSPAVPQSVATSH